MYLVRRPKRTFLWTALFLCYVYWFLWPMLTSSSSSSSKSTWIPSSSSHRRTWLPKWLRFWPFYSRKTSRDDWDDFDWGDSDLDGFDLLDLDDEELNGDTSQELSDLFDLEELLNDESLDDGETLLDEPESKNEARSTKAAEERQKKAEEEERIRQEQQQRQQQLAIHGHEISTLSMTSPGPAITYVTGTSSSDFGQMIRTLYSIRQYETESVRQSKIYLWDFGMSAEQLNQVAKWANVEVVRFIQSEVPTLGRQTWRPLAIHKMTTKFERILWLDPGTTVECPLDDIRSVLDMQGAFALANTRLSLQTDISNNVKDVLEFSASPPVADNMDTNEDPLMTNNAMPVCATGAVGFDVRPAESPRTRQLVDEWAKCARLSVCMSIPATAQTTSLQPDQAALSVLFYKHKMRLHPNQGICLFTPVYSSLDTPTSAVSSVDLVSMMLALQGSSSSSDQQPQEQPQ